MRTTHAGKPRFFNRSLGIAAFGAAVVLAGSVWIRLGKDGYRPDRGAAPRQAVGGSRRGRELPPRPVFSNDLAAAPFRSRIVEIYHPILATLGLAPAALGRLEELLIERMRTAQDVDQLSKDLRLDPSGSAKVLADAQETIDREIEAAAGGDAAAMVRRIASVEAQLDQVREGVAGDLAFVGVPLSGEQSLALAEVLRTNYAVPASSADCAGGRTVGFDPATGLSAADRRTLALAGTFLSPAQCGVLGKRLASETIQYAVAGP